MRMNEQGFLRASDDHASLWLSLLRSLARKSKYPILDNAREFSIGWIYNRYDRPAGFAGYTQNETFARLALRQCQRPRGSNQNCFSPRRCCRPLHIADSREMPL